MLKQRRPKEQRPAEPYLGDVVDMRDPQPFVLRPYAPADYHWGKRAAVVVLGIIAVWYGIIAWVWMQ